MTRPGRPLVGPNRTGPFGAWELNYRLLWAARWVDPADLLPEQESMPTGEAEDRLYLADALRAVPAAARRLATPRRPSS